ncbi:MAG: phenylacetate--CoA ligase family protein [Candidatus Thermoplasmatota archaeon]|nr:phenylacetate--CoA ligase family protein [Candidatus Thermoplasmatota archaeon]MBS3802076.1 phenylacetate--CoA ligase family protein [Candidatus Thermoplasmatota archaeon]
MKKNKQLLTVMTMNPLFNPFISFSLLKKALLDPNRIKKKSVEQIQQYKNKAFRKMVSYAYSVPVYHQKYKKAGIHPNDIKTIEDIKKLPFISKDELKHNFGKNILPKNYNQSNAYAYCTGGTTGKPLCLYTDFYTVVSSALIPLRELRLLNIPTKNLRFVHIGNFNPNRIDLLSQQLFEKYLGFLHITKNQLNLDVSMPLKDIIKKMDQYNPDIIMTYPATFQHLSYLKRNGHGKNIKPKLCWTGGAMLDEYTRTSVQDAFDCPLLNIYPSVEASADIGFECYDGTWHVHDDFFHLEAIDEQEKLVETGKRGHIVLTRLWGRGTPIIRYTGMDDWVTLTEPLTDSCGLTTTTIKGGVEGRKRANIILPNGNVFPPGAFCFITPVLTKLQTFKVKQYQIIQQDLHHIDILLVIDEKLRNTGAPVEKIKSEIKKIYEKKVGGEVEITIKEVDEIPREKNVSKPPPIVISHVKSERL